MHHRQLCLDTETTGLHWETGHRIIEIGIIELVGRQRTGNDYHVYINPQRSVDESAIAVHGITNEFLDDKPTFREVSDGLLDYLSDAELIIHNAGFDLGFLNMEFSRLKVAGDIDLADGRVITDTLQVAKRKHVGKKNNLDALCSRYGIDSSSRVHHGALLDADLLASVYLSMSRTQHALGLVGDNLVDTQPDPCDIDTSELRVVSASESELAIHHAFTERYLSDG
ncbi:MAG: DNA polymerase III subunit epsilon [Legionellales bacterium]|nr:DNA polymerase III subunit epsilon [Legionellales bacterium]|tara:strand:+ start:289 stop:966 length:678 start_codon:yes stop_codon:yes gene_type:complete